MKVPTVSFTFNDNQILIWNMKRWEVVVLKASSSLFLDAGILSEVAGVGAGQNVPQVESAGPVGA